VTPSVSSKVSADVSDAAQGLTTTPPVVCTPVCTSDPNPEQPDALQALAAALLGLSPADRARLTAMLLGQQTGQGEGKS
jgi:hypothetical protein